ncbi:MAG: M1 family metallopeptidase [Anaerolineae bacterium]
MSSSARTVIERITITLVIGSLCACRLGGPPATQIAKMTEPPAEATRIVSPTRDQPSLEPTVAPAGEPTQEEDAQQDEEGESTACDVRRGDLYRAGLIEPAHLVLEDLRGATVYEIDLQIADDLLTIEGRQRLCYTNREDEPLDEIYFRLFPNILGGATTVSDVRVDSRDVQPSYELAESAMRVPVGTGLQPGDSAVVEMDFEVEVATEMEGSYGLFGLFDGTLSLHEVYPVIPVYDDEGWNVELPPPSGDITYYDVSFYRVQVRTPADLVVVASGVEVAREEGTEDQTLTFAAGPARGFYLAASREYTSVTESTGETTINSYALVGQEEAAGMALEFAVRALTSFGERFGAYPYTEFDVVSTPMMALGMEYPGIVAVTRQVYSLDDEVRGVSAPIMMEGTVGHEVAHQWFYNLVGNDQIDEPWLDEALAQYLTGLYYLDRYGERGYEGWRGSWLDRWERVDRAAIPIGLPVAEYETGAYGAVVYGRGPLFIEALAKEMEPETFEAFLRDYVETHAWDIGTGEAFKGLAEKHCQCDLTPLFREWVYPE